MKLMTKLFFVTSLLIIPAMGWASFEGSWMGVGYSEDSNSKQKLCPAIFLAIEQTAGSLKIERSDVGCAQTASMLLPGDLEVEGSRIYFLGSEVGFIMEDVIYVSLPLYWRDSGEWGTLKYSLTLQEDDEGRSLMFQESQHRSSGETELTLNAFFESTLETTEED